MMLDDLIVVMMLLAFVSAVTAIRLKARAQRARTATASPSRAHSTVMREAQLGAP